MLTGKACASPHADYYSQAEIKYHFPTLNVRCTFMLPVDKCLSEVIILGKFFFVLFLNG